MAKRHKKVNPWEVVKQSIMYLILILASIMIVVPFLFALSTSFTSQQNLFDFKWIPDPIDIGNYAELFATKNVAGAFLNTFMYTIPTCLLSTFNSALCAYACARIRFKGSKLIFSLITMTIFIPGVIILAPSFVLFATVYHWYGTPWPIIIPGMFGSAGSMLFLYQYFKTLPKELEEAAEIDGMGKVGIFLKIILPLSVPALLTQFILGFNGAYNDYLTPLLYVGMKPELWTIQLLVKSLSTAHNLRYPLLMAGAMVALVPTLILFICCQKFFTEGIAMSGIKG
ncbi:MAG: carbohydrate ABC transporter permease [Candidatus Enteromonas sp.]|nr:carbohydrate ABC transporter permease [Candidatus Enteromonas sp.]